MRTSKFPRTLRSRLLCSTQVVIGACKPLARNAYCADGLGCGQNIAPFSILQCWPLTESHLSRTASMQSSTNVTNSLQGLYLALEAAVTDVFLRARGSEIFKAGGYPVMRLRWFSDRTINKHRIPYSYLSRSLPRPMYSLPLGRRCMLQLGTSVLSQMVMEHLSCM